MPSRNKCLAVIVIVILLIIVVYFSLNQSYKCKYVNYLEGFWVAPDSFSKQVGLDKMYMYINDKLDGYIVMERDGDLIANNKFELNLPGFSNYVGNNKQNVRLAFEEKMELLPERVEVNLNISKGTLSLSDDEKMYCYFIKDLETSLSI
jgi:hypothetical protein